jgi:tripartite-type tricarboxylate transporter receptor subunit TctC
VKKLGLAVIFILASPAIFAGSNSEQITLPWRPAKPITIIVPWGSDSFSYQVTRAVADVLEQPLDQNIYVDSQPGVSGSVGTGAAFVARHDGYTWSAGSASDLGGYKALGLLDTTWDDWVLFLHVADVSVVAVVADSPYETFGDLIAAFEADPGTIIVASTGASSGGDGEMKRIADLAKIAYAPAVYDSGDEAVAAADSGEVDVVIWTAAELVDPLRDEELRGLAVLGNQSLTLEGYGVIAPVTDWVEGFAPALSYYGIWVPKDVPPKVLETFEFLWENHIVPSEALSDYAAEHGVFFDPGWGVEVEAKAMLHLQTVIGIPEP